MGGIPSGTSGLSSAAPVLVLVFVLVLAYRHGLFRPRWLLALPPPGLSCQLGYSYPWSDIGQMCRSAGKRSHTSYNKYCVRSTGTGKATPPQLLPHFFLHLQLNLATRSPGPDLRPNERPPVCAMFHCLHCYSTGSIWGSRCNRSLPSRALRACRSVLCRIGVFYGVQQGMICFCLFSIWFYSTEGLFLSLFG